MSDKNAFQTVATALGEYVERCTPALRELSTADAAASRGEGKWTRIQILGHLIDSAANNHQRFIRAQESTEELVFPKYEQDHWVSVQGYSGAEWSSVVSLWEQYNLHLANVIAKISSSHAEISCRIGEYPPMSLAFLASDYLVHAKHHMKQILA